MARSTRSLETRARHALAMSSSCDPIRVLALTKDLIGTTA
jgi:hypothetical protein